MQVYMHEKILTEARVIGPVLTWQITWLLGWHLRCLVISTPVSAFLKPGFPSHLRWNSNVRQSSIIQPNSEFVILFCFVIMRVLNLYVSWLLCLVALAAPTSPSISSTTVDSSPNPIGTLYPTSVTGTINGTIAVVPIRYELARSIIPAQYGILKKAYTSLLPGFPADKYPVS